MNNLFSENYYKHKYLKYKSKYLYEKNNLSGGLGECVTFGRKKTPEKAKEMKESNCPATDFKDFEPDILGQVFTTVELKDKLKFGITKLIKAKKPIDEIIKAGFTLQNIITTGYDANLLRTNGYTLEQLQAVGFTPCQLKTGLFPKADFDKAGLNYMGTC